MTSVIQNPLLSVHQVKSYELDSFGHVNNAIYLNLFEGARNDYMLQRGLQFTCFAEWKAHPIVAEAAVKYRRPSFVDDRLMIFGSVEQASAVSFTIRYHIKRQQDGEWIAEGTTRMAFVDDKGKPTRIPEEFRAKFIENSSADY